MCACAQALELTTQAGSGWARERQRFLQGSTSGPAAVAAAGGGGEDLDAVAVAAAELLLPLQHWRRVPRMEALAAAGGSVQDRVGSRKAWRSALPEFLGAK